MLNEKLYKLTKKEKIMMLCTIYFKGVIMLTIFYNNIYIAIILALIYLKKYNSEKNKIIEKRKEIFLKQFKDFLHSYLVALSSGDICESGIETAYNDLKKIYSDDDYIIIFLSKIIYDKNIGITTNKSFDRIKEEIDIEEITNFVTAFDICYKSGGNMNQMIRNTIDVFNNKFEMKDKVSELVSEKKYEMKLISYMPVLIILLLNLSAPEYMKELYNNFNGYLIITLVCISNTIANKFAERIMNIKY